MSASKFDTIFTKNTLTSLFPPERANDFFDALFGDASEGAYNISLEYKHYSADNNALNFELHLAQRPGKCLACNLTYGLPEVFSRHPVINIAGLVQDIGATIGRQAEKLEWELGHTVILSQEHHVIPLVVSLSDAN